jgi:hypothetical protein
MASGSTPPKGTVSFSGGGRKDHISAVERAGLNARRSATEVRTERGKQAATILRRSGGFGRRFLFEDIPDEQL